MQHLDQRILGLSIGTKEIGLAFIKNRILFEWQMKTFTGPWSKYKLRTIQVVIGRYIEENGVDRVAIKVPDEVRGSNNLNQLVKALKKVCIGKTIPVHLYTIIELKKHCARQNKKELMEFVSDKYLELNFVRNKQKGTKNSYYIKLFEAVAVADMVID